MQKRKAAELVLDYELYPRNNVDSHNIRNIMDAMAAGVELPPVIIDKKSKRVVDGFHRVKAAIKFQGDDAKIECIEKSYKDDAAMFLDAMRYNGTHGAKLDTCDRTHCVIISERLGLSLDAVAGALNMPIAKLGKLRNDRMATSGGHALALKQTIRHKAGQRLTKRQSDANDRLSGMNQSFYVNQLIELIESELLDTNDERLMERVKMLFEMLEGLLVAR